jgi:hypothetical protein
VVEFDAVVDPAAGAADSFDAAGAGDAGAELPVDAGVGCAFLPSAGFSAGLSAPSLPAAGFNLSE